MVARAIRERKKGNRLDEQNYKSAFASPIFFFYNSGPWLPHYNVKAPNFSFLNFDTVLNNYKKLPTYGKLNEME